MIKSSSLQYVKYRCISYATTKIQNFVSDSKFWGCLGRDLFFCVSNTKRDRKCLNYNCLFIFLHLTSRWPESDFRLLRCHLLVVFSSNSKIPTRRSQHRLDHPQPIPTEGGEKHQSVTWNPNGRRVVIPDDQERKENLAGTYHCIVGAGPFPFSLLFSIPRSGALNIN